ncbi:hypothetical protein [Halorubrum sp. SD683]|uniref:hypothetical protein n=1 Tax=Halorubrum sp. SD683 TaxID=1855873 RepID=UPI0018E9E80C|nr:hypothetical protein [Halorubrum sp. SD683]
MEQEQVITNIEVLDSSDPVRIHIGELVDSGAKLDHNQASYWISVNGKIRNSGVYLENPNSPNATVIISTSAIPKYGRFDLHINNIDTTNVSKYNQRGEKINRNITYTAEQGKTDAIVNFSVSSSISARLKPDTYTESARTVIYNYSKISSLNINNSVTIWRENNNRTIGEKVKTLNVSNRHISLRDTDIEGETRLTIGIHSPIHKHGLDAIYSLHTTTVNVSVPAQIVRKPLYYSRSTPTLLFEFNTNISDSQGYIITDFSNKDVESVYLAENTDKYDINGRYLYVYPLNGRHNSSHRTQPEIDEIEVNNIHSTTSRNSHEENYSSLVRVEKMISDSGEYTVSLGSNIGIRLGNKTGYKFSKPNGNTVRKTDSPDSRTIHNLSTVGLDTGYYNIGTQPNLENPTVQLVNSTTTIEAADTVTRSQIAIDIGATGTKRTAILSISKSGFEEIYRDHILLDPDDNTRRSIFVSQPGTYTAKIRDLDTNQIITQDVRVVENRNPTVYKSNTNNASVGGKSKFYINSTYDNSTVYLTSTTNSTTTLEMTTTDTGPTPVSVNTYASPNSSAFVTTGSGVDIESVTGHTDPLSPGTYNLTLRSKHGTETATDAATVTVRPRSTGNLTAYTTRAASAGDFANATEIREAIADGTLAPAATATANDTVVYGVNASGLTGLPAAANASLERGEDLARLDGLSFGVAPADADDANGSTEGEAVGRMPNESAVHLDRDGLFLVADGEHAFGTETPPDPGETFEGTFRVDDDRLRETAANDRHRVTTNLTYGALDPADSLAENATPEGTAGTNQSLSSNETAGTNQSISGNETAGTNQSISGNEIAGTIQSISGNETAGTNRSLSGNETAGTNQSTSGNETAGTNQSTSGNETAGTNRSPSGNETVGTNQSLSDNETAGTDQSRSANATVETDRAFGGNGSTAVSAPGGPTAANPSGATAGTSASGGGPASGGGSAAPGGGPVAGGGSTGRESDGSDGPGSAPANAGSGADPAVPSDTTTPPDSADAAASNRSDPTGGSTGVDANRSTRPPDVGISVAPGRTDIPSSAGPSEAFGTGGLTGGDGPGPADPSGGEQSTANRADERVDAQSTDSAESSTSSEASGSSSDAVAPSDLGYDDAPIRSTAYDLPGFGAVASAAAIAGASLLARRRGRNS